MVSISIKHIRVIFHLRVYVKQEHILSVKCCPFEFITTTMEAILSNVSMKITGN